MFDTGDDADGAELSGVDVSGVELSGVELSDRAFQRLRSGPVPLSTATLQRMGVPQ